MRRAFVILLTLVLMASLSPLFAVIWASSFAARHGCDLHEGFANPCIIDGKDWGETLYTAFVSGWFMLITLPVAALAAVGLAVLAVAAVIRHIRERRKG